MPHQSINTNLRLHVRTFKVHGSLIYKCTFSSKTSSHFWQHCAHTKKETYLHGKKCQPQKTYWMKKIQKLKLSTMVAWNKKLNLPWKKSYSSINFLCFLVTYSCFTCYKIRHVFRLKGSIALNINIIELVVDDENEWPKFSILNLDCFKWVMTPTTLKIHSMLMYDFMNLPKAWQAKKNLYMELHHMICPLNQGVFSLCWSHKQSSK